MTGRRAGSWSLLRQLFAAKEPPAPTPVTPRSYEEVHALCTRYLADEITAEQYFDAVDRYAVWMINAEMKRLGGSAA